MDKNLGGKSFEVWGHNGRCGKDEKNEWPRRTDKSQMLIIFLDIDK